MAKRLSTGALVRRYVTLTSGLLECAAFSGIIFGWTSLVFVLKREKYFDGLCPATNNSAGELGQNQTVSCAEQDERFALIFTVSSFTNAFVTLPNGLLLDHCGTSLTRAVGITVYTVSTLMMALSSAATAYLLFPALCFTAFGGMTFLMTNIQVGNLFGEKRSTVITIYSGAFDSSSIVFFIVKVLYEAGLTLRSMFLFISSLSLLHILRTIFLLPKGTIPYPVPQTYEYGLNCKHSETVDREIVTRDVDKDEHDTMQELIKYSVQNGDIDEDFPDFRSCVRSSLFFTSCIWLSLMQLRHFLFMGTLNPMLSLLAQGDPNQVSKFTNAFAITQLFGIFIAPWNGLLMDRNKKKSSHEMSTPGEQTRGEERGGRKERRACVARQRVEDRRAMVLPLGVTVGQCVAFSLCASIPRLEMQYLTFILQVINRSFLYGGHAAFIATMFPSSHFGKVYGLSMSISALVSLLQYPCFALVKGPFHNDPLYLNISFVIVSALTCVHPLNVHLHCQRKMKSLRKPPSSTLVISGGYSEQLTMRETGI